MEVPSKNNNKINSSAVFDSIDGLVMDWLIRSGYQSTFIKLPTSAAAAASSSGTAGSLNLRAEICRLIRAGGAANINTAVNIIESTFPIDPSKCTQLPSVKSSQSIPSGPLPIKQVLFLLKIQLFIELVRQKNIPAAVAYVKSTLMPNASDDMEEEALQEALGVLAYADPFTSPLAWIFDQSRRYIDLASLTNSSLYSASSSSSSESSCVKEAPLIGLLRQVYAVDELIGEVGGFGNDLDDRKWSTINQFLHQTSKKEFIKTVKTD